MRAGARRLPVLVKTPDEQQDWGFRRLVSLWILFAHKELERQKCREMSENCDSIHRCLPMGRQHHSIITLLCE